MSFYTDFFFSRMFIKTENGHDQRVLLRNLYRDLFPREKII